MTENHDLDVVIVGAGFAGMYMLHKARGLGLSARCIEAGGDVGGTWYWNRYPGARCDVESMQYSYEFSDELQQEWDWSERYATQPEILSYAQHVADRFDLRNDIEFDTRVESATFDDTTGQWTVGTDRGDELTARYVVMATGCLSSTNLPDIPGRDSFEGASYHTGRWPHEGVDFTGLRVGVIGTGSSAIQSIPLIAQEAAQLHVFQRTPSYSVPAHNRPLDPEERARIKADYAAFRDVNRLTPTAIGGRRPSIERSALEVSEEERRAEYEARWADGGLTYLGAFTDLLIDPAANATAADFIREQIEAIVEDPEVAKRLMPDTVVGCKRMCVDTGYYATFNRPNVHLVDLRETPIEEITPRGIRTSDTHRELDAIVFATGFDAMTGALLRIDIKGRDGQTLQDAWEAGPRTYLGLGIAGFPNLFVITGPGSPSVLTNMLVSIQHHVEWIADCIAHMRERGLHRIEATLDAQDQWVDYVNMVADFTLFPSCNSWYLGANVPGKARVFMPLLGFPPYVERCTEVAEKGYEGFALQA
jgi:cyclohexanone monooxygenase